MTKNLKISLAMVATVALALVVVAWTGRDDSSPGSADEASAQLVRADSHRLSDGGDGEVTFVEFLDFECEACGAAYPAIEQLRETYGDRVTFVVRYFPLHNNSEAAARAAEAAAEQDKFEEMYDQLFQNQAEWGHQESSQEDVFFGYAEDLGLDMDRFRATYDDPATMERIQRDQADGRALGVSGTPTFFLNGDKVEVSSLDELIDQLDAALES